MHTSLANPGKAFTLIALGLVIAAMGVYVAEADDAPGAGGMALLVMAVGVVLGVRAGRGRLPAWAARTAIAVGIAIAIFAAVVTRSVAAAAPLFPQAQEVPSVAGPATPPQYRPAVDQARALVRQAVRDQNLPGISVAVGAGLPAAASAEEDDAIVWAEGFGWRDVGTQTPVTPETRFNIGSAAPVVMPAAAILALTHTGVDPAAAWSPEHIGEPEEDAPFLALFRHTILQPLGITPAEYPLPDDRATFYVPTAHDNNPARGRRLMRMRDLACCADGMAFYSTPSDLVRVALERHLPSVNGELAGGTVASLLTDPNNGIVVAVTSNMAYADTAALAKAIADAFAADRPR